MLLELNAVWTLAAALLTIELGRRINRLVPPIERSNIPPAVSAGLVLSLVLSLARAQGWIDVRLSLAPRDTLLLVFFASLGFGAHLKRLGVAGSGAAIVCMAIALAIVAQNLIGAGVAHAFGAPAALGLFAGSIAFLGGHGTATAWSGAPQAQGLDGAFEIGIGAATLGLVLGGLVAGPIGSWLMARAGGDKGGAAAAPGGPVAGDTAASAAALDPDPASRLLPVLSSDRWLVPVLLLTVALGAGPLLGGWAQAQFGIKLPGFLSVMLVAVLLTNAADLAGRPIDTALTDLIGTVALRIFLAIALLALDWAQLVAHLPMLLTAAVLQVLAVGAIAVGVVFMLFGRNREGAAAAGGFVGFALGAMPVGLAVMRRLNQRYGDTPRALLAITLAAALFADTANALSLAAAFNWLAR